MKKIKIAAGMAHVDYGNLHAAIKEATDAGVDYIHSDAADMYELKNLQLMGGHQIIAGIRPVTPLPIECHFYTRECDRLFVEKIAKAGCNMLVLPAELFLGANLAYLIDWCHGMGMKIGLTVGCYTPLCFLNESIYDIDRLHVVIHGARPVEGEEHWSWRRSSVKMCKEARQMIRDCNPDCELAVDGGLRYNNLEGIIEADPDVLILSTAVFGDPDGITAGVKKCRAAIDAAALKFGL